MESGSIARKMLIDVTVRMREGEREKARKEKEKKKAANRINADLYFYITSYYIIKGYGGHVGYEYRLHRHTSHQCNMGTNTGAYSHLLKPTGQCGRCLSIVFVTSWHIAWISTRSLSVLLLFPFLFLQRQPKVLPCAVTAADSHEYVKGSIYVTECWLKSNWWMGT